jgi:hypothetical protein
VPLDLIVAFLWVAAVVAGAVQIAKLRRRDHSGVSDASHRILIPSALFAGGLSSFTFIAMLGQIPFFDVVVTAITVLVINGIGSLVVVALTDAIAKRMEAWRTTNWLLAALASFAGIGGCLLLLSLGAFTGYGLAYVPILDLAVLVALAGAAALVWWSMLPPQPSTADVFE